jgi:hypothetical protein
VRSHSRSLETDRMILLAPPFGDWPATFNSIKVDTLRHQRLLADAQWLRARAYCHDGAINRYQLSSDGRFVHSHDEQSWHLLVMDDKGRVAGCARYCPHKHHVSFSELSIAESALASCPEWGSRLRRAVESKRAEARRRGYSYGELGGWALKRERRHTLEALRISVNMGGLMKLFGGALAVSTATIRHRSSSILKKLGGQGLFHGDVEIPSYYDPKYRCEMEIVGFDSDVPNPKYVGLIKECQIKLRNIAVVCAGYRENMGAAMPELQMETIG